MVGNIEKKRQGSCTVGSGKRAGPGSRMRLRKGSRVQPSWPWSIPRVRWGASAGWGYLGERICSQSKFANYNWGTVICWLELSKKSSSEAYGFRDFPGIGQLVLSSTLSGGQWEKTLSFPLLVPGRLFSVSNIWVQVEKLKWVWLQHFKLGHLKTAILLVQQSPPIRKNYSAQSTDYAISNSGPHLRCETRYQELWEVTRSRQNKTGFSLVVLFFPFSPAQCASVNGPPGNKMSFICIYKTVYTDVHTITLGQSLKSTGWEGKDNGKHFTTNAQEDSGMETKVGKLLLGLTLERMLSSSLHIKRVTELEIESH